MPPDADKPPIDWGRIVVPVAGGARDGQAIAAAAAVARRHEAELLIAYTPPDPSDLTPWLTEGFGGGIQANTVETLREAGVEGERAARAACQDEGYAKKRFLALKTPVWRAMAVQCRLADLVVFGSDAAQGQGPLAEIFELVLMEERAAILVARGDLYPSGIAVVAWNGGDPASRAARRAVPLLRHASRVVITGAMAKDEVCGLDELRDYYALRGIGAEVEPIDLVSDMGPALIEVAKRVNAGLLVAGAYARTRLREFIFGGATRALLHGDGPSLFLAH
ncbi:MAG TPA: universal stress protein [Caulobacteraceae bacterium]|jgi:nucleotide-binding universal stress UspA family protein|nr:universal stress protein [Caulobacteraceae bacterium]